MARKKSGIAFTQRGVTYTGIRTRDGKRVSWPVSRETPPPDGTDPLQWARLVSLQYQAAYDKGTWEPGQKQAEATPVAVPTFGAWVVGWTAKRTYESAPRDQYYAAKVAASPVADVLLTELRPRHGVQLAEWLRAQPSSSAPRTVRDAVALAGRALESALTQELILTNALRTEPVRRALPKAVDKTPGARSTWRFTAQEIDTLVTDTVTPVTQWLHESVQCLDHSEALLSAEESLLIRLDFSREIH